MDVPTRTSYVLAVPPGGVTLASGVTNLVRLGGWAASPFVAGALMTGDSLAAPLVVGAAMKLATTRCFTRRSADCRRRRSARRLANLTLGSEQRGSSSRTFSSRERTRRVEAVLGALVEGC